MIDALAITVIVAGLALAAFSLLMAYLKRPVGKSQLAGAGIVEVLLLAQAVTGIIKLIDGQRPDGSTATFTGYLIGLLLIPPAAAAWGLMDRSRWGSAVIAVSGLVVPVMVVRLQQIWDGVNG